MTTYRDHLFVPLNEGTAAKKVFNKVKDAVKADSKDAEDKPAWYNPLTLAGRLGGYITKRLDQGFNQSYGGPRNAEQLGYGHSKLADNKRVTSESHLFRP